MCEFSSVTRLRKQTNGNRKGKRKAIKEEGFASHQYYTHTICLVRTLLFSTFSLLHLTESKSKETVSEKEGTKGHRRGSGHVSVVLVVLVVMQV